MFEERFIRMKEVMSRTGLSKQTIHRMIARQRKTGENLFPYQREISDRATGWLLSEILEWIRTRPVSFKLPDDDQPRA